MGCSASKPATDEEKQEICKICAKEMLVLFCIDDALADPSKITIKTPPSLEDIKITSKNLREAVAEAKEKEGEKVMDEEPAPASGGGGMMGMGMAMLGKAMEVASDALEKAAELGEKGVCKSLVALADMLDKAIEKVEQPMTEIGKDVVTAKKAELSQALKDYVNSAAVPNAASLCMEEETDAISKKIITESADTIKQKMMPLAEEFMKEHAAIKAWDSVLDSYNAVVAGVEKLKDKLVDMNMTFMADWSPQEIKFDVPEYICMQTVLEIGRLCGIEEAKHRANPDQGAASDVFKKVFKKVKDPKKDQLTEADYKLLTKSG